MGRRNLKRFLVFLFAVIGSQGVAAECEIDSVEIRGDWGQARFAIEVADDPIERGVGLMHRESMPQMAGMLFIYDEPQRATFWMRNTLIPLDMLFIDERGVVQHIHENAVPLDETTIDGGEGRLAVLEVNGGMTSRLGIDVGSELRHPAFSDEIAAWPCAASQ